MKLNTSCILMGLTMAVSTVTARADLQLDFSGLLRSSIQFNTGNDSFQFQNSTKSGSQWYVNNESGGAGAAVGSVGTFGTGTWNIGSVTTVNGVQSASVTTSSAFQLSGLSGTVSSARITTSGGTASLVINLTGLSYSGNNSDLVSLSKSGMATVDVVFALSGNGSINGSIIRPNFHGTSYTGTISAVPEATTSLAGAGAVGLLILGTGMIRRATVSREGKKH